MDVTARSVQYAHYISAPYVAFLNRTGMLLDIVSAKGAEVISRNGTHYIDCIAGYGNCIVGHNPTSITQAVVSELQSARPFNLPFIQHVQVRLAEKLAAETPGDLECSFVVNSGSEAVETGLKLARLATGKSGIICTSGSWHGFTFGCLSISERTMCHPFLPLLPGVKSAPYGDINAIDSIIDDATGCVIVEPIQSENGAVVPPPGYLRALQELCNRRGVLLIFDEVKTGIAKTGRLFACEHDGAIPDILVCGKALGGGVMPIGAVIARRSIWSRFGLCFPMSSSSGAGNAPACAAALATLELVRSETLCERAEHQGKLLASALRELSTITPDKLLQVSGKGLLIGLKLPTLKMATQTISLCAQQGVLVMNAFCDRSTILIEPPACISTDQTEIVSRVISTVIKTL